MRATHSGFLFQILLIFMQIAQSPKDANTGISSLLYTRRTGLQSMPPRPPPRASFTDAFPIQLQRKSAHLSCDHMLPQPSAHGQAVGFLSSACQKDAGGYTVLLQGWGGGNTRHTDHPGSLALSSGLEAIGICLFCCPPPTPKRLPAPGLQKTK